jgi:FlaG/FlaF family flagellin (archaellin)
MYETPYMLTHETIWAVCARGELMTGTNQRGTAFGGAIFLMATLTIVVLTAAFFFGDVSMDSTQTELPEPDIEFEYVENEGGNEALYIRHQEGARVNPAQLSVDISGASCTGAGDPNGTYLATEHFGLPTNNWLAPEMALIVDDDNPQQMCDSGAFKLDGATVTLQWQGPDGQTKTIDRWTN